MLLRGPALETEHVGGLGGATGEHVLRRQVLRLPRETSPWSVREDALADDAERAVPNDARCVEAPRGGTDLLVGELPRRVRMAAADAMLSRLVASADGAAPARSTRLHVHHMCRLGSLRRPTRSASRMHLRRRDRSGARCNTQVPGSDEEEKNAALTKQMRAALRRG